MFSKEKKTGTKERTKYEATRRRAKQETKRKMHRADTRSFARTRALLARSALQKDEILRVASPKFPVRSRSLAVAPSRRSAAEFRFSFCPGTCGFTVAADPPCLSSLSRSLTYCDTYRLFLHLLMEALESPRCYW